VSITSQEQLAQRLASELAPLRQLKQSEDMEDFYQAVDWVRGNCAFTSEGDVVFHGGTQESIPVRCPNLSKRDPLYRLLKAEAERNNTHLNPAVTTA
jgi:hypothetical protein